MRQSIKVTETELKNLIMESVKSMLNEEYCWYGDTKPLEQIYQIASQIADRYKPENEDDYDEYSRAAFDLWRWAENVADKAENFIHCNADNIPINGGGNW